MVVSDNKVVNELLYSQNNTVGKFTSIVSVINSYR